MPVLRQTVREKAREATNVQQAFLMHLIHPSKPMGMEQLSPTPLMAEKSALAKSS